MAFLSQIEPSWEIREKSWVVSLLNSGSKIGGHAVIVVEGIQNNRVWVGQYDITASAVIETTTDIVQDSLGNTPGYIDQIRIFEGDKYGRDYSNFSSKSWTADPEKVAHMITKIKEMQARLPDEKIPFQKAGSKRWPYFGGNGGDNCVTWAEKQLAIAGVGNAAIKADKIKASPAMHVTTCAIL